MEKVLEFMSNYYLVDLSIVLVGLLGITLMIERVKALYFDYPLDSKTFTDTILNLIRQDKIEEAIAFCAGNEKKPLAFVAKRILERSDRDEKAIQQAFDGATSEMGPRLVKSLGHLAMIANVVTMTGLLGTVTGLIVAFKAVAFADASQKQALLSQGISMAMTATALGLMIAIPIMFIYSFLHSRQSRLFAEIDNSCTKIVTALEDRFQTPFNSLTAYPADLNKDTLLKNPGGTTGATRPTPPQTKSKAS